MKSLLIAAAGLAASTTPAQAQVGSPFPAVNAAIEQIYRQAEVQCRRIGLHLRTNMDTVFGVEDADGHGTTGFIVGPLQCANTARPGVDPTTERDLMCRRNACRQWFVLGENRRARLVWSGYGPTLSGVSGYLQRYEGPCADGSAQVQCPRLWWNGTIFTQQRPRRSGPRRRR